VIDGFLLLASEAAESFEKTVLFLIELVTLLIDYMRTANDRNTPVIDFKHPHELRKLMQRCLQLHSEPQSLEQILDDCKQTMKYCVKTGRKSHRIITSINALSKVYKRLFGPRSGAKN